LVSGDGTAIVGTIRAPGVPHVFRWTANAGKVDIVVPGAISSSITDISYDGSVFVGISGGNTEDFAPSLWRWTAETGAVVLQDPTTDMQFRQYATHLSADGSIITGERQRPNSNNFQAYRWTAGKGFETLLLPGYASSSSYDITPDGKWILGAGWLPTDSSLPVAQLMLWSEDTGSISLRDVFERQGLAEITASWATLDNTYFFDLPQISADGRTITGTGINPVGHPEAWVAYLDPIVSVPEPTSARVLCVIALGILMLSYRSHHAGSSSWSRAQNPDQVVPQS
jgi:uncharacterized membrane protein